MTNRSVDSVIVGKVMRLFMKIRNAAAADLEYKLYFNLGGVDPDIHYEGNSAGTGAGYKKPGTIVNDSTNVDAGYTAELKIDLTGLGFDASTSSVLVVINIFDPDNYSDGVLPWGPNGNFAKQFWGSEWGAPEKTLLLSPNVVPVELTSFTASVSGNTARLLWSTATETNNRGFDVERSINNSEFTQVGFVKGNGTSTITHNYSFTDQNLSSGTKYSYRLKQIDLNGQYTYSQTADLGTIAPVEFALNQNYPNPFNPSTKVSFSLPVKSIVTLDLYNLLGQKVMTLISSNLDAGNHDFNLDASRLNSGVYIYTISASGENGSTFTSSKKMTLIK